MYVQLIVRSCPDGYIHHCSCHGFSRAFPHIVPSIYIPSPSSFFFVPLLLPPFCLPYTQLPPSPPQPTPPHTTSPSLQRTFLRSFLIHHLGRLEEHLGVTEANARSSDLLGRSTDPFNRSIGHISRTFESTTGLVGVVGLGAPQQAHEEKKEEPEEKRAEREVFVTALLRLMRGLLVAGFLEVDGRRRRRTDGEEAGEELERTRWRSMGKRSQDLGMKEEDSVYSPDAAMAQERERRQLASGQTTPRAATPVPPSPPLSTTNSHSNNLPSPHYNTETNVILHHPPHPPLLISPHSHSLPPPAPPPPPPTLWQRCCLSFGHHGPALQGQQPRLTYSILETSLLLTLKALGRALEGGTGEGREREGLVGLKVEIVQLLRICQEIRLVKVSTQQT